ncbi:MAG: acetate kinase [Coriobacteriales bacterium]|jgi:acetate kinase|nr:acetate kinase [Coriobacteriales bacterium]
MNVLVLNAGSSSLKYQLVDMDTEEVITRGLCERVGTPLSFHKHGVDSDECVIHRPLPSHHAAVLAVLEALTHPEYGAIADLSEIQGIGHRVVHGGDYFAESVIITDEVIARIEECSQLAPLHNPAALAGIQSCGELMPDKVQVATFDTAFHQSMPPRAYRYALPPEYYEQHRIRRYGFHGTSHRYVAEQAALFLQRPLDELKLITCHLGNGCSLTAIDGGRSVDTSMGFTPLEGLMMGTRSGSIDPAIVLYLIDELGMDTAEIGALLNRLSGLLGVSQSSNDMRDVRDAAEAGNADAALALELYAHAVLHYLGSYVFALGGVDAIVFTAGVGENSADMRQKILTGLEGLGICLDAERNAARGGERTISSDDSQVKVLVIPTNEELMIARDVKALMR